MIDLIFRLDFHLQCRHTQYTHRQLVVDLSPRAYESAVHVVRQRLPAEPQAYNYRFSALHSYCWRLGCRSVAERRCFTALHSLGIQYIGLSHGVGHSFGYTCSHFNTAWQFILPNQACRPPFAVALTYHPVKSSCDVFDGSIWFYCVGSNRPLSLCDATCCLEQL